MGLNTFNTRLARARRRENHLANALVSTSVIFVVREEPVERHTSNKPQHDELAEAFPLPEVLWMLHTGYGVGLEPGADEVD